MTLKNDGRSRKSKASKNKDKSRKIKCSCKEITEYYDKDITHISGISFITCDWCGKEIKLK